MTEGNIISYEEYYPYGSTSYQAGRSAAEVGLKRYRYTGKERDEETGLNYHGARYYAPWLGRWTSPDPAGFRDSASLYVYVAGNPSNLHDPTGHRAKKTFGGLTVSPNSQISAEQWVEMIKKNEKLEPWMKSLFAAKGNRIVLTTDRPRLPKGVNWEDVPEWFKSALVAINSEHWHLTTAVSIVSEGDALHKKLIADRHARDPDQGIGVARETDIYFGSTGRNPSGREGLVVVANRFRDTTNKGLNGLTTENAMLHTFFHELAAHASPASQDKPGRHESPDWALGLEPMSKADQLASDVSKFFDTRNEQAQAVEFARGLGPAFTKHMKRPGDMAIKTKRLQKLFNELSKEQPRGRLIQHPEIVKAK